MHQKAPLATRHVNGVFGEAFAQINEKFNQWVNGQLVAKPAFAVGPGDVLTFAQGRDVRVIRIVAPGERRGPAPEAQALYEDLDPPEARPVADPGVAAPKFDGGGRPSKRDRRALDGLRREALE